MVKYKIEFEKDKCIGARSCNDKCSSNWEMKEDGKSEYKIEEFDDDQLECNMNAAKACPVKAIHIINQENKEKLI
ncbi:ferredoxin [Candidatus Woesearchaeota archaeon]|jgi:ferredoxin|nr:ferredoxin [Candidatus Woesearchaeota archaeon]MBT5271722.1 ferredoxin [Candidatus Woesearchaeota archaeon]MBT6041089.1 ferredoxin [Candidatus Woesearchaeota archaeon]MBT6337414.1 ferredoxin [Candidatus Woesearchaeota archaeon]MBT7926926.1 ferredoxin [Candidatus Woesearchaeota archaeon]